MTWRLWRALLHGAGFPIIFKRVYIGQSLYLGWTPAYRPPSPVTWRRRALQVFLSGLSSILIWLGGIGLFLGLLCLLPLFLLVFLLEGVYFGGRCALDTGERIATERDKRTYELLCVTPAGYFGVNWSLCTGYLRHYELFDTARRVLFYLSVCVVLGAVAVMSWSFIGRIASPEEFPPETANIVPQMMRLAALAFAFYLNFIQSVIIGCLIGMLVPTYTHHRLDTQLLILLAYLFVLMITIVAALLSISLVSTILGGWQWFASPIIELAIFYGWREFAIASLWRRLLYRLNASDADVQMSLRPALS